MKTIKIRIAGMHCESCEKLLKNRLSKVRNIKSVDLTYNNEIADINYEDNLDLNEVINVVREAGYDAISLNNQKEKTTLNHYLEDLRKKERIEGKLITFAVILLLVLGLIELIAYYGFFQDMPNFFSRFGYYLIFLIVAVAINALSIWHIKAYGNSFTCMTGMMIGMTIGMTSGFLIGLIIGATNGMFIGTLAGVLIGMAIGIWCGKCCGVMGAMEGIMAGLMGGLMGAMTSLMLFNDHLNLIISILVAIVFVILIGLDYMVYKEVRNNEFEAIYANSLSTVITFCIVATIALTLLMVYGPKSILFQ